MNQIFNFRILKSCEWFLSWKKKVLFIALLEVQVLKNANHKKTASLSSLILSLSFLGFSCVK